MKSTKQLSYLMSQWVTDKGNQWSDLGPIEKEEFIIKEMNKDVRTSCWTFCIQRLFISSLIKANWDNCLINWNNWKKQRLIEGEKVLLCVVDKYDISELIQIVIQG